MLLDNCSTCNVPNNREIVTYIHKHCSTNSLNANTNDGVKKYDHLANLMLLPIIMYFKENYMATILSLKTVREIKGAPLTMDTSAGKSITLTLENGVH